MSNQESTAKCPTCGTPATQPIKSEVCSLSQNGIDAKFEEIVSSCIVPAKLTKFHQEEIGVDPCILCRHNCVTETPGSFINVENGPEPNTWLEIHACPHCQTTYSIDTRTNATSLLQCQKSS